MRSYSLPCKLADYSQVNNIKFYEFYQIVKYEFYQIVTF